MWTYKGNTIEFFSSRRAGNEIKQSKKETETTRKNIIFPSCLG